MTTTTQPPLQSSWILLLSMLEVTLLKEHLDFHGSKQLPLRLLHVREVCNYFDCSTTEMLSYTKQHVWRVMKQWRVRLPAASHVRTPCAWKGIEVTYCTWASHTVRGFTETSLSWEDCSLRDTQAVSCSSWDSTPTRVLHNLMPASSICSTLKQHILIPLWCIPVTLWGLRVHHDG